MNSFPSKPGLGVFVISVLMSVTLSSCSQPEVSLDLESGYIATAALSVAELACLETTDPWACLTELWALVTGSGGTSGTGGGGTGGGGTGGGGTGGGIKLIRATNETFLARGSVVNGSAPRMSAVYYNDGSLYGEMTGNPFEIEFGLSWYSPGLGDYYRGFVIGSALDGRGNIYDLFQLDYTNRSYGGWHFPPVGLPDEACSKIVSLEYGYSECYTGPYNPMGTQIFAKRKL